MDAWLPALPELRSLNLNGCTAVRHVVLTAAATLESLDIAGCGAVRQVAVSSPALRSLVAAGCSSMQVG